MVWTLRTTSWTGPAELDRPRRVLTERAAEWAVDRLAALQGTTASLARDCGGSWSTMWAAVERVGRPEGDGPANSQWQPPTTERPRSNFLGLEADQAPGNDAVSERLQSFAPAETSQPDSVLFEAASGQPLNSWATIAMVALWRRRRSATATM